MAAAVLLGACGGGAQGAVVAIDDPVCDAVATLAGVWGTSAPPSMLGNAEALADFAAGLQGGFERSAAVVAAAAPPEVGRDLDVVVAGLAAQYRDALAYAAGDMSAVPLVTPAERQALGGVRDWSTQRCPDVAW